MTTAHLARNLHSQMSVFWHGTILGWNNGASEEAGDAVMSGSE